MEQNTENIKYCKYYKGEEECPASYIGTSKGTFWQEEMIFIRGGYRIEDWERKGRELKAKLAGEKLRLAEKYTPKEFGMLVFIETHYSSFDPYNDITWIYEYY